MICIFHFTDSFVCIQMYRVSNPLHIRITVLESQPHWQLMDYLDSRLFITSNQQISKSSKGQPEDDEDDPEFRELDELDESESELLLFEPPLFFCFSPFEDELELELSSGLATVAADFALGFAFALPFGARFGKTFGAAGAATGTDAAAEEEAELVFFLVFKNLNICLYFGSWFFCGWDASSFNQRWKWEWCWRYRQSHVFSLGFAFPSLIAPSFQTINHILIIFFCKWAHITRLPATSLVVLSMKGAARLPNICSLSAGLRLGGSLAGECKGSPLERFPIIVPMRRIINGHGYHNPSRIT